MIYLSEFRFPSGEDESNFFCNANEYSGISYYPFRILPKCSLTSVSFEPVTILYGGNGCGKTTALNIIAEKLKLNRDTLYNRSEYFEEYTELCSYSASAVIPKESKIITSDDVFDYMLNLRCINERIDNRRKELFAECAEEKYSHFRLKSLDDYEQLKKVNASRSKSTHEYTRTYLMDNAREHSNGESAFIYFNEKIRDDCLYLLDEPENSLSPQKQLELCRYLEDSVRFFNCQFIIATHSPFILSMSGAKIYDLDSEKAVVRKWTELDSMRAYFDLFNAHKEDFLSEK